MVKRNHLQRLDPRCYLGMVVVHWVLTIQRRHTGWLTPIYYFQFRELLTHALGRGRIACPIFCLMPDHIHMIWIGIDSDSDQRLTMRRLRKHVNRSLVASGYQLQDQAYDHVLREDERSEDGLIEICDYIARNPERAGLVPIDGYRQYFATGCLVPGYPELVPFEKDFWDRFDRCVSYLRRERLGSV